MTRAERLERIGTLLAKGIALMLSREAQMKSDSLLAVSQTAGRKSTATDCGEVTAPISGAGDKFTGPEDDTESAILGYLSRVGSASPKDIQQALELSKATAFRRLTGMAKRGQVVRSGKTSAIRYRTNLQINVDGRQSHPVGSKN